MAVDPSKLMKLGRRSLGAPPIDGSPGIDGRTAEATGAVHTAIPDLTETRPVPAAKLESLPGSRFVAAPNPGESAKAFEGAPVASQAPAPPEPDQGENGAAQRRQRVPPPSAEPRVPFTTRITASTKERLEDACYHLRVRHQAFIDAAIQAHLDKHGF